MVNDSVVGSLREHLLAKGVVVLLSVLLVLRHHLHVQRLVDAARYAYWNGDSRSYRLIHELVLPLGRILNLNVSERDQDVDIRSFLARCIAGRYHAHRLRAIYAIR